MSDYTPHFRDDIDPANTWVTSDTHFGHDNIVGFCHRPGSGVREDGNYGLLPHEEIMLAEWRKEVPADATVIHLGDLAYKGNSMFKHLISKELTGARKLLIQGNHDGARYAFYRDCGFEMVRPFSIKVFPLHDSGLQVTRPDDESIAAWTVSFSHYAWNPLIESEMPERHLRLHGHIHNNGYTRNGFVPFLRNHINLSVEQTKYRPVNLKLLLDGALLGNYPITTEEQQADAEMRRKRARGKR